MNEPEQRDPRLDRAYRETPRDEPSPELDERIRAAARRAVSAGPQSLEERTRDERRRSWVTRWRVPLSVAATVAIAVGLTLRMQEVEHAPAYDAAPAAPAVRPPPAEAPRPAAPGAPDAARRAPEPAPMSGERQVAPSRSDPQSAAKPAAPPAESAPRIMREERAKEAEHPAAADPAARSSDELLEMRRQTAVPAAAPPAPAATSPAPAAAPLPSLRAAPKPAPPAGAAAEGLSRDRALGDRPGRAMRESSAAAVRTPETWLEHIRSLLAQGREAEAAAELAEFRRAYPDFKLPADLGGPGQ